MDGAAIVAENIIEEAMKQGVFDDLPGKGKPLDLSCDPFESSLAPTIRRILRDNEVADLRAAAREALTAGTRRPSVAKSRDAAR